MTMSDPIADMLTRIRNANTAKHDTVDIPSSKMKLAIAQILLDEGYIRKFDVVDDGNFKTIRITLKYGADKNEKIITGLKEFPSPVCAYMLTKKICPKYWVAWVWPSYPQTRASSPTKKQENSRSAEKSSPSYGDALNT